MKGIITEACLCLTKAFSFHNIDTKDSRIRKDSCFKKPWLNLNSGFVLRTHNTLSPLNDSLIYFHFGNVLCGDTK